MAYVCQYVTQLDKSADASHSETKLTPDSDLFSLLPEASCFKEVLAEGLAAGFGHLIIRCGHEL